MTPLREMFVVDCSDDFHLILIQRRADFAFFRFFNDVPDKEIFPRVEVNRVDESSKLLDGILQGDHTLVLGAGGFE